MTKKLDLSNIVSQVQKSFKDDRRAKKIGLGSSLKDVKPEDCILMPSFWTESTNTPGLPFGRMVLLAGNADSGKTSLAIQVMKAAQEQDVVVIYCETEGKSTPKDLMAWGVDPEQVILIQTAIAEDAFEAVFRAWDAVMAEYPESKLLVIIDSIGNIISQRDANLDLSEGSSKPGGHGHVNRLALNKIIAKMEQDNAALLLISYTYDNIGSVGKKSAGGEAMHLFSSLHYQTVRVKWLEAQVKGRKVRIGARVAFKLQKNHIDKTNPGPKEILFDITKAGMDYVKEKEE